MGAAAMAKPGMLLALAIAVTVQICVVTADEMPMIGDDSIALVEEGLGEAAAPKDVQAMDPEEAALATMKALKEKRKAEIKAHNHGVAKQKAIVHNAKQEVSTAEDTINTNTAKITQLAAQYSATKDPAAAAKIEAEMDKLRAASVSAVSAKAHNKAAASAGEQMLAFHQARLTALNAVAPLTPEQVQMKVEFEKKKAAEKVKHESDAVAKKLRHHAKVTAAQASSLAMENVEILKKLDATSNEAQLSKDKAALSAKVKAQQQGVDNASYAVQSTTGDEKVAAEAKLGAETRKLNTLKQELNGLSQKAVKDPIDNLTPEGKAGVLAVRKKIMQLKMDIKSKVTTYDQDLKNLQGIIKETKTNLATEKDKTKLAKMDAKLKEWNVAQIDLMKKHKVAMAEDSAKLKKLQEEEQRQLTQPPTKKAVKIQRKATKEEKAAAAELENVKHNLKKVVTSLNDVELATTERDVAAAQEVKTRDAIKAHELAQANTPSSKEAKLMQPEIDALRRKVVKIAEDNRKASLQHGVVKEVAMKKQQFLTESTTAVQEQINALKATAAKAPTAQEFDAMSKAAADFTKQLMALKAEGGRVISNYKRKQKAMRDAKEATAEAVKDAMQVAEGTVSTLSGLETKMKGTADPEALTGLKTQVRVASEAQDEAFKKLDSAKAAVKKQTLSALKAKESTEDEAKNEELSIHEKLAVAQEQHAVNQKRAQESALEFAKFPENKPAKQAAQSAAKAVDKSSALVKKLTEESNIAKEKEARAKMVVDLGKERKKSAILQVKEQKAVEKQKASAMEAAENKKQAERLRFTNKQMAATIKQLVKSSAPDKGAVAKAKRQGAAKMKAALDKQATQMRLDHEITKAKAAQTKAAQLSAMVQMNADQLAKIKTRIRVLSHRAAGMTGSAKDSVLSAVADEKKDEKLLIAQLRTNVAAEKVAQDKLKGYQTHLKQAENKQQQVIKKEKGVKSAAKKTMDAREKKAREVAMKRKKEAMKIRTLEQRVAQLKKEKSSPSVILAVENSLSAANAKAAKDQKKASLARFEQEKAQIDELKLTAVQPLDRAKADVKAAKEAVTAAASKIKVQKEKIKVMSAKHGELQKEAVEIPAKQKEQKLKIETEVAKRKGLLEAARAELSSMKEDEARKNKVLATKTEIVTSTESKSTTLIDAAPAQVKRKIQLFLAKREAARLKAKKLAAQAAKKEADRMKILNVTPDQQHVDSRVDAIIKTAQAKANAVELPILPAAVVTTKWTGNVPDEGKPPKPPLTKSEMQAKAIDAMNKHVAEKAKKEKAASDAAVKALADAKIAKDDAKKDAKVVKDTKLQVDVALAQPVAKKAEPEKAEPDKSVVDSAVSSFLTSKGPKKEAGKPAAPAKAPAKKDAKPKASLLDYATEFLQVGKWMWNGPKPKGGPPKVPRYMRVAANDWNKPELKKKKVKPAVAKPFSGAVKVATDEQKQAKKDVKEKKTVVAETKKQVEITKKAVKQEESAKKKEALKVKLEKLKKGLQKSKNALGAAEEVKNNLAMQVDAARVGAGTESPGKAIKDIKKDKENIDKGKLKKASDIVEVDEVKANKLMADRTKAMDDQRKMRKIEATAKSPAVKSAAKSMERKEGDKQLLELQKLQAVRAKEDKDRAKRRKAAATMDEDATKLQKLIQGMKEKMEVQKHTTKKIMDYEGQKFKRAVQSRMKARIEEAKALLQLQKAQKRVKTVTTVREEEKQKSTIAKAKRNLFIQTQHKQKATLIANTAETAQHRAALALKAKLAQGMEKIIAARLPTRTEQQQKADGKLQAADVMLKTQNEFIKATKEEVANLNAKLANQQSKRLDFEKQAKNVDRQVKAIKKRPVPELPKGIKAPASIANAKKKALKRKKAMLLTDAKATARAEVKTALAIEKSKRDLEVKMVEATRLATVRKELSK